LQLLSSLPQHSVTFGFFLRQSSGEGIKKPLPPQHPWPPALMVFSLPSFSFFPLRPPFLLRSSHTRFFRPRMSKEDVRDPLFLVPLSLRRKRLKSLPPALLSFCFPRCCRPALVSCRSEKIFFCCWFFPSLLPSTRVLRTAPFFVITSDLTGGD